MSSSFPNLGEDFDLQNPESDSHRSPRIWPTFPKFPTFQYEGAEAESDAAKTQADKENEVQESTAAEAEAEKIAEKATPSALPSPDRKIVLEVGTRHFVTTADTLDGGAYFRALLRGPWQPQEDGSFFVDADPDLFGHVLRFLRHGALPLFYDRCKGHDYGFYGELLKEAQYFGVNGLVEYLEGRGYLKRVRVLHSVEEIEGDETPANYFRHIEMQDSSFDISYHPTWAKTKVYQCPRGITKHRGSPGKCGRQCRNAKGDEDQYVDEDVVKLVRVKREFLVD